MIVRVVRVLIGRPDHADRADRHEDVPICRHLTAVYDRVHEPVVHRDHDPSPREDPDIIDPCERRDLSGPRPGGINGYARTDLGLLSRSSVAKPSARHFVALAINVDGRAVGKHLCATRPGAAGRYS